MMKKHIFDVGANNGSSTLDLAKYPENIIHAFEPTPELYRKLKDTTYKNYLAHCVAVDLQDGYKNFNFARNADWGCSSFYEFSDNLKETWPGRTDFVKTDTDIVQTIRLDSYISAYNHLLKLTGDHDEEIIYSIDYLHCDTQGNDLNVLKSLGDYINILQGGMIEAFAKNPLYKEIDNSIDNSVGWLEKNGFVVHRVTPNDVHGNEFNIQFGRKK